MIHTDTVRKDASFKFLLQKGEVNVLLNAVKGFFIHSKSGNSNSLSSLLDPIAFLYADGKRVSLNLIRANSHTGNSKFNDIVSKAFEPPFDSINEILEKMGHPVRKKLN